MTTNHTMLATALAAMTWIGTSGNASAAHDDTYEHLGRLAHRLENDARVLKNKARAYFRHTSQYDHLASDVAEIVGLATHVHQNSHYGANLGHLRSDVRNLDRLLHHTRDLVERIEYEANHGGHYGHHGSEGHIHGSTRYIYKLLTKMEDRVHHMTDDLNQLAHPVNGVSYHPSSSSHFSPGYRTWRPAYAPATYRGRNGLYFGGRNFGFNVRF